MRKYIQRVLMLVLMACMMIPMTPSAAGVGQSLDNLTGIEVIQVSDIKQPVDGIFSPDALVFRYEAHPTNPNYLWNGRPINEAPRADTDAFAEDGAIRLMPGDKVTYTNKFDQTVTFEATSVVPDFKVNPTTPEAPFVIGNQHPGRPSADISISIEGENRPTYVAFTDLDYSDSVAIRREDIRQIIVKDDNLITYTEEGDYIRFHGLQGRAGTSPSNQTVWITVLLKDSSPDIKIVAGNYTWIVFEATKMFPKSGTVLVKYITEDGQVLQETTDVVRNVPVNTQYTTQEKTFDGYEFVRMDAASAPKDGVVVEGEQTVIYVYRQLKGNVFVKHMTEDGQVLQETTDVLRESPIGTAYTTQVGSFRGYEFTRMDDTSAPQNGEVKLEDQTVIYVYRQLKGNVFVKYMTEDGQILEETTDVLVEQPIFTPYHTQEKTFDGYEFIRMEDTSAPRDGEVKVEDQTVVYVYRQLKGNVFVKYMTEDGKILSDTEYVAENQPIKTVYQTEQRDFEGYEFIRMEDTSAPRDGEVKVEDQTVIYVYRKLEPKRPELPKTGSSVRLSISGMMMVGLGLIICRKKEN